MRFSTTNAEHLKERLGKRKIYRFVIWLYAAHIAPVLSDMCCVYFFRSARRWRSKNLWKHQVVVEKWLCVVYLKCHGRNYKRLALRTRFYELWWTMVNGFNVIFRHLRFLCITCASVLHVRMHLKSKLFGQAVRMAGHWYHVILGIR